MAEMWVGNRWDPRFKRILRQRKTEEWEGLNCDLANRRPFTGSDRVSGKLEPSRNFSTSSLYKEILRRSAPCKIMGLRKARIPSKIKTSSGKWLGIGFRAVTKWPSNMDLKMRNVYGVGRTRIAITSYLDVLWRDLCGL